MPTVTTNNNLTDAAENAALDYLLDGTYLALFTTKPAEDGSGGVEVSGGGYAALLSSWNPASGGAKTHNGTKSWTAAGGNFGTIVAIVARTLVGGGVIRAVWDVTPGETINDGGTFTMGSLSQSVT